MDLYNLNDEEYSDYIEGLCLSNQPIPFYNKKIRHLTVKELFLMGETKFNSLILPYAITKEMIKGIETIDVSLLDIIYNLDKHFLNAIQLIKIVFDIKDDDISVMPIYDNGINKINIMLNGDELLCIDDKKFNELRTILLKICNTKELKESVTNATTNFADKTYNNRFEKLYKGRAKSNNKKKKINKFYNIYNCVVHSENIIDYENKLNWNIYQLFNTYKTLNIKESHDYTMRLYSSGMVDTKGIEVKSLYEQISK
ncbi:MAG: hypothetical protein ACRC7N_18970 [Clostridium sp.]